jgi:uncharacterized protein YndB with AHSA1/START domain
MRHFLAGVTVAVLLPLNALADDFEKGAHMKPGEYWYRMDGQDGQPCGYAKIGATPTAHAGNVVVWELRVVMQGTSYQEERGLAFEDDHRLAMAYMKVGEDVVCDAKWDGANLVGKARVKGKMQDISVPRKPEHMTGMGFMLALEMPLKVGATWKCRQLDEANGLVEGPEYSTTCEAEETLKIEGADVNTWRFSRTRAGQEQKLVIWVSEDRRLVQADWGFLKQTLSSKPTKDLFQPPKDVFQETDKSTKEWLELKTVIPGASPEKVFDWWTKPELLTKWWPPEAEIELKEGGKYTLTWKSMKWILEGKVKSFERGKSFVFTWRWNFDAPEVATQEVHLAFQASGTDTVLVVRHGPYLDTAEDVEGRKGHIQGWNQFGRRLIEELGK